MSAEWITRRRRWDSVLLACAVLLTGLAGLLAAVAGSSGERITGMWVGAQVAGGGGAHITEVIDYDFAGAAKHGILRRVPVPDRGSLDVVAVTMDGAPVAYQVSDGYREAEIRIGEARTTVTGTHRYRVEYTLPRLGGGDTFEWDAVGTDWEVPVEHVDVYVAHVAALNDVRCRRGPTGERAPCTVEQPARNRIEYSADGLDAGEGVTLEAYPGAVPAGGTATLPATPDGAAAVAVGNPPFAAWWWVTAIAAVAALATGAAVRILGRDRVTGADGIARRRDIAAAARSAEPVYEPPPGLNAAQAGILLADRVRPRHMTAWLLAMSTEGHLRIEGSAQKPRLTRTRQRHAQPDGIRDKVLAAIFVKGATVTLGKYNKGFATGWPMLRRRLREWHRAGGEGLWSPWAATVHWIAMWGGTVLALSGVAVVYTAGLTATTPGADWRILAAAGALAAGIGAAALITGHELRTRTAEGSRLWLHTEGYRRYLHELADRGWRPGEERALTAWAVALGETDALIAATKAATVPAPDRSGSGEPGTPPAEWAVHAQLAASMHRSAAAAAAAPSATGGGFSGTHGYSGGGDSGGYSGGGDSGGGGGGDSGGGGGGSW